MTICILKDNENNTLQGIYIEVLSQYLILDENYLIDSTEVTVIDDYSIELKTL